MRCLRRRFPRLTSFISLMLLVIFFLGLAGFGAVLVVGKLKDPYEKKAKDISIALSAFKKFNSKYPANFKELIGSDPTRENWEYDAWGIKVLYQVSGDLQSCSFTSAGKDKVFNTADDIKIFK